jgi:hypothetical protein
VLERRELKDARDDDEQRAVWIRTNDPAAYQSCLREPKWRIPSITGPKGNACFGRKADLQGSRREQSGRTPGVRGHPVSPHLRPKLTFLVIAICRVCGSQRKASALAARPGTSLPRRAAATGAICPVLCCGGALVAYFNARSDLRRNAVRAGPSKVFPYEASARLARDGLRSDERDVLGTCPPQHGRIGGGPLP